MYAIAGGGGIGSCVCKWVGSAHERIEDADSETAIHVASCGLCVLMGRAFMEACTCANCAHRRYMRKQMQDT